MSATLIQADYRAARARGLDRVNAISRTAWQHRVSYMVVYALTVWR